MTGNLSRSGTELLGRAWPGGVPLKEAALLGAMPAERAEKTLDRLRAVLAAEDGEPIGELAAGLGMDRPAFFRLRARWRAERSLRSIAPFAGRKLRRAGREDLDGAASALVLEASAEASAAELANALVVRAGNKVARTQALAAIRRARLATSTKQERLSKHFGRALLRDITALDLNVSLPNGTIDRCIGIFMLERSSGLILGHAAGQRALSFDLEAMALDRSLAYAGARDPQPDRLARLEWVAGEWSGGWFDQIKDAVDATEGRFLNRGDRRFGERMVSLIGPRLSRIAMRPRSTFRIDSEQAPPILDPQHASALIDDAVYDHNLARLSRLAIDLGVELQKRPQDPARLFIELAGTIPGADEGISMMSSTLRLVEKAYAAG